MAAEAASTVDVGEAVVETAPFVAVVEVMVEAEEVTEEVTEAVQAGDEELLVVKYTCKLLPFDESPRADPHT